MLVNKILMVRHIFLLAECACAANCHLMSAMYYQVQGNLDLSNALSIKVAVDMTGTVTYPSLARQSTLGVTQFIQSDRH